MYSHTGCICLSFLHCVFSHVSSDPLPDRMHNHIGCNCLSFLRCVLSNVSSKRWHKKTQNHIGCICLIFLHCAFRNVAWNGLHGRMCTYIGSNFLIVYLCQFLSLSLELLQCHRFHLHYDRQQQRSKHGRRDKSEPPQSWYLRETGSFIFQDQLNVEKKMKVKFFYLGLGFAGGLWAFASSGP